MGSAIGERSGRYARIALRLQGTGITPRNHVAVAILGVDNAETAGGGHGRDGMRVKADVIRHVAPNKRRRNLVRGNHRARGIEHHDLPPGDVGVGKRLVLVDAAGKLDPRRIGIRAAVQLVHPRFLRAPCRDGDGIRLVFARDAPDVAGHRRIVRVERPVAVKASRRQRAVASVELDDEIVGKLIRGDELRLAGGIEESGGGEKVRREDVLPLRHFAAGHPRRRCGLRPRPSRRLHRHRLRIPQKIRHRLPRPVQTRDKRHLHVRRPARAHVQRPVRPVFLVRLRHRRPRHA